MPNPQYQYDPTGTNPANRIDSERKTITVSNGINGFLLKPAAAPFFGDSLVIINSSGIPLIENTHYYLTHPWKRGSDQVNKKLFGSVSLIGGYPVDTYSLVYRTIGGDHVGNSEEVIEDALIASATDYLTVDWSTAPTYFPAAPHSHDLNSTFDMVELYHALMAIADSIKSNDGQIHVDDILDIQSFWMNGCMSPFLNVMDTMGLTSNQTAVAITKLIKDTTPLRKNASIPEGINNITINLGGGFMAKIGSVEIPNTVENGNIRFTKPFFTTGCMWVSGNIKKPNANSGILKDQIYFDTPAGNGVDFTIEYDTPKVTGNRHIKYFAIGR